MGCVNSRESTESADRSAASARATKLFEDHGLVTESGEELKGRMPLHHSTPPPPGRFTGPVVSGGPLTQKDYNQRIVTSGSTQTVKVPDHGYSLSYAYVSQRGYYPEALDKPNQDCFCVHTSFGGDPNCHFFGVFDGHGEHGTACSQFARDRVVQNLLKDPKFAQDPSESYSKSFVDANAQLHRHHIDDSMSGTTAIALCIRGKQISVANVGDSRATSGIWNGRKLIAMDLSTDQTPFRQDECDRVKKCGARVLTLDQLEGLKDPTVQCWGNEEDDDGDPPRLWTQTGMYPGTAFTRSIGDSAAERIGVYAEPECSVKEITPETSYLVVASDGVFEFLSSQAVLDMVSKFDDVQEACNALVAESYRLWLQYETRTDDITIAIIKINGLTAKRANRPTHAFSFKHMHAASFRDANGLSSPSNRPVRRMVSKAARATIQAMLEEDDSSGPYTIPANQPRKTDQELAYISEAVKANFLFLHLSEQQRRTTFEAMQKTLVAKDEVVIQQGDKGEHFYVIQEGEFDVYVAHEGSKAELVHTYSTKGGTHASFGELSLMYGKPRAATVKARTAGVLWRLDRRAFRGILHKKDNRSIIKVLRSVEVLQSLNIGQLQRLADTLTEEVFTPGQYILRQGDVGNEFYIITQGQVTCTVRKDARNVDEPEKEVLQLGANQYFGERALLGNAKRAANVIAQGKVNCLYIGRDVFEEVLGPLQFIINADRKWREKSVQLKEAVAHKPYMRANLAAVRRSQLDYINVLYQTEICTVASVRHKSTGEIYLLKNWGIERVVSTKRQNQVIKEHNIHLGLSPAPPIIPNVLTTFKDDTSLSLLCNSHITCNLDTLLNGTPFTEPTAAFYAASIVCALEHLHNENVVHRSWNPENILVEEDGHLAFVDFQFSKQLDGPTYTLCGLPEYLAPEMVENQGHTQAVDFWALGVLVYYMLTCETPFADPSDSEIKVFSNIANLKYTMPKSVGSEAADFIDKLLVRNPNQRLGYGQGSIAALKKHPWLRGQDWDALGTYMRDTVSIPSEVNHRLRNAEKSDLTPINWEQYRGDKTWFADF
mmetsp:Transcript_35411/g.77332  ORF Transcript_35411/g.77332 Transcript_35411/m.77332 type:complete len:1057 (-) Transcript_35411:770-3940(-)